VSRWEPGASERIAAAAIELFTDRGFENTTAEAIAERAGVTRRTFFRYFADKRDVLFGEYSMLAEVTAGVVAAAPTGSSAVDVLSIGLHRLADDVFAGQRDHMRILRRIIVTDESLREREQHKNALIADAGERAFIARGFAPSDARLAAGLGVLVLSAALDQWIEDDTSDLGDIADAVLSSVASLTRASPAS
jgi:AcrR family transcriptional regulator